MLFDLFLLNYSKHDNTEDNYGCTAYPGQIGEGLDLDKHDSVGTGGDSKE